MKLREHHGVVVIKGGQRPEINVSDGERRLFDISSVSTSSVWDWVAEIETMIDIVTLRSSLTVGVQSRLKTEVYEVVSAQLHAFARLQSLDY